MTSDTGLKITFSKRPFAEAVMRGSPVHSEIQGKVLFYKARCGVVVCAELTGLPTGSDCNSPVFGFHIHSGAKCTGNNTDPFADTNGHYNPHNCQHPYHAGDLPPLFGACGGAFSVCLTDRFSPDEIIGKTVIVHAHYDDFVTQPSGNSGEKIACGVIKRI